MIEIFYDDLILNSNLNQTDFTQPTPVEGVTILGGGYVKIGSLVVVNIRISNQSEISSLVGSVTSMLSDLPKPLQGVAVTVYPVIGDVTYSFGALATDGVIRIALSNYVLGREIRLSCAYISAD